MIEIVKCIKLKSSVNMYFRFLYGDISIINKTHLETHLTFTKSYKRTSISFMQINNLLQTFKKIKKQRVIKVNFNLLLNV